MSPLVALMHDQAKKLSIIAGAIPMLLTNDSEHTADSDGEGYINFSKPRGLTSVV